jgi:hypothetical protein
MSLQCLPTLRCLRSPVESALPQSPLSSHRGGRIDVPTHSHPPDHRTHTHTHACTGRRANPTYNANTMCTHTAPLTPTRPPHTQMHGPKGESNIHRTHNAHTHLPQNRNNVLNTLWTCSRPRKSTSTAGSSAHRIKRPGKRPTWCMSEPVCVHVYVRPVPGFR